MSVHIVARGFLRRKQICLLTLLPRSPCAILHQMHGGSVLPGRAGGDAPKTDMEAEALRMLITPEDTPAEHIAKVARVARHAR